MEQFNDDLMNALGQFKWSLQNDKSLLQELSDSDGSTLPTEYTACVDELSAATYALLWANDFDVSEFVNEKDPRLAIVGMALLEAQWVEEQSTRASYVTACVLQAVGLYDLTVRGMKKAFGKVVVKTVLKRVPYLGAAIMATEFAVCMVQNNSGGGMIIPRSPNTVPGSSEGIHDGQQIIEPSVFESLFP